jgi:hypothetical protein
MADIGSGVDEGLDPLVRLAHREDERLVAC